MTDLLTQIKAGILNLDANKDDRFALMVEDADVPINYIKSVDINKIHIGRAFALQKLGDDKKIKRINQERLKTNEGRILTFVDRQTIFPNVELIGLTCFLIQLSQLTLSRESDVSFKINKIMASDDHLWFPDKINENDDIWVENIIVEVTPKKGVS